jgi:hypothetical protein
MVEKTNTVSLAFRSHTDIEGMDLQDFKDFLGISSTVPVVGSHILQEDILSEEGLRLLNDAFISTSMAISVFGQSPVLQNISPEYDFARGLVYDLFMSNLSLYNELCTLIHRQTPSKHEIN